MNRLRGLSVRWLLVGVLVAFTALVLLVQWVPLADYLRTVERDRIVTGLQRDAFTLAGGASLALLSENATDLVPVADAVTDYSTATDARVVVTDATGTAVVTSDGTDLGQDYSNRTEIAAALGGEAVAGRRASQTAGEDLLYVAVPVRAGADVVGAVRITYPAAAVDDAVDERVRGLALVGGITLLAAAGIAALIAGVVTGPLRRLRETSEAIAGGDLSARVDTDTVGELHDVAASFNVMAARVEAVVASQRGFAGDASHQLRTPLTALRLRIETAQQVAADDPEALAPLLDSMQDEVDRMQRLVDGLLVLARADRDQPTVVVDAAAVVAGRCEEWQPLAAERGVTLVCQVAQHSLPAHAVPDALEQIVDNYLDNAVEVAPVGSEVVVGVGLVDGWVQVSVTDAGPGLTAEQRSHAFDRFWRGGEKVGGAGLGLSIAKALADASGAQVRVDDAGTGAHTGLRAVVMLRPG